jgi:hypothetical protein
VSTIPLYRQDGLGIDVETVEDGTQGYLKILVEHDVVAVIDFTRILEPHEPLPTPYAMLNVLHGPVEHAEDSDESTTFYWRLP